MQRRDGVSGIYLLRCLIATAMLVALSPLDASPLRQLGSALTDQALVSALAEASLTDAFAMLSGAAEQPADRHYLVEALLRGLPVHRPWLRHLLAARYLEQAFLDSTGTPRAEEPPEAILTLLTLDYGRFEDPTLQTIYFRICSAYQWPPSTDVLMYAGSELLEFTRTAHGRLDASRRRLVHAYFNAALLSPDPALGRLIDEIRRLLRDRDLVVLARNTASRMFD